MIRYEKGREKDSEMAEKQSPKSDKRRVCKVIGRR